MLCNHFLSKLLLLYDIAVFMHVVYYSLIILFSFKTWSKNNFCKTILLPIEDTFYKSKRKKFLQPMIYCISQFRRSWGRTNQMVFARKNMNVFGEINNVFKICVTRYSIIKFWNENDLISEKRGLHFIFVMFIAIWMIQKISFEISFDFLLRWRHNWINTS